jgi:hypothetical protein
VMEYRTIGEREHPKVPTEKEEYVLLMRSAEGQCLGYFVADDTEVSLNLDEARKFDRENAIAYCLEQNDSWDHSDGAFFHIARYENS